MWTFEDNLRKPLKKQKSTTSPRPGGVTDVSTRTCGSSRLLPLAPRACSGEIGVLRLWESNGTACTLLLAYQPSVTPPIFTGKRMCELEAKPALLNCYPSFRIPLHAALDEASYWLSHGNLSVCDGPTVLFCHFPNVQEVEFSHLFSARCQIQFRVLYSGSDSCGGIWVITWVSNVALKKIKTFTMTFGHFN